MKRINLRPADIQRHGNEGIGKPEALEHDVRWLLVKAHDR